MKFNKTKEWLVEEYVINQKSRKQIAEECGLTIAGLKSLLVKWNIKKPLFTITKEDLQEHLNNNLTVNDIAKLYKVSHSTINKFMLLYDLHLNINPYSRPQYDNSKDEFIASLYLNGLSTVEIAKELNVSVSMIRTHLYRYGIETRSLSESQWNHNLKEFPKELLDKSVVEDLYTNKKLSKKDLGKKFNCTPDVIDRVLKEFKIPIRNSSESKKGMFVGNKHPNWQGGITTLHIRLRQFFYDTQVPQILKRDNYCCQLCGSKEKLQVHHIIHYSTLLQNLINNHSDLDPINDVNELYLLGTKDKDLNNLDNLITYCKECHLFKIHGYKKILK